VTGPPGIAVAFFFKVALIGQPKGVVMARLAQDVMTSDPVCCGPQTSIDEVAKLMVASNCGEIPIVDSAFHPIGVVTDRDIVCRIVAEGKNPIGHMASEVMSQPVVTVLASAPLDEVVSIMERHQIRRVPVVDAGGCCTGIIAQADIARVGPEHDVAELVREVSRDSERERSSILVV
jgi:CBS domain-containing protein